MNWKGNLLFMAPLSALVITMGLGLTLFGFWPILPFAGLELACVFSALYWVSHQGDACERVVVDTQSTTVEKGFRRPNSRDEFPSAWAEVKLLKPKHEWYPNQLVIGSHGRRVRLGEFLTDQEREELADLLAGKVGWAKRHMSGAMTSA